MLGEKDSNTSVQTALLAAASTGARTLLLVAESVPLVGPFAILMNQLVVVCDQAKCNKEAFSSLKSRLDNFAILFSELLKTVGSDQTRSTAAQSCLNRLQNKLNEANEEMVLYVRSGFISHFLSGSKPQQTFNSLDADLTSCLNELALALQVHEINALAKTYNVVCGIKNTVDNQLGGLDGLAMNQEKLQQVLHNLTTIYIIFESL